MCAPRKSREWDARDGEQEVNNFKPRLGRVPRPDAADKATPDRTPHSATAASDSDHEDLETAVTEGYSQAIVGS